MSDPIRILLNEVVSLRSVRGSRLIEVRSGELTTTLVVSDGELVAATATKPGEPLGRIMRRKRIISPAHYIEVLERVSEVLTAGDRVRFGEVAVGLGYAKPEDVAECLTEQVRGLVVRAFQAPALTWTTGPLPADRDRHGDMTMHVEAIFLDAVRWLDDARKGALGLDDARTHALEPAWPLSEIDARFELTPDEAEFARVALAGDKTVAELCSATSSESVDAHAVLTALIAAGSVKFRDRGRPLVHAQSTVRSTPPAAPPWATVDAESARRAVVKVMKARTTVPTMQAMVTVGASLRHGLDGEREFQRGRALFRTGQTEDALKHFERASAFDPASCEYRLLKEWCLRTRSGTDPAPADLDWLVRLARATLEQNGKVAFAYFVLAEGFRVAGKPSESRAQLAHALALDAELFESIREKRVRQMRTIPGASSDGQRPRVESPPDTGDSSEPGAAVSQVADVGVREPAREASADDAEVRPVIEDVVSGEADEAAAVATTDVGTAQALVVESPAADVRTADEPGPRAVPVRALVLAAFGAIVVLAVATVALNRGETRVVTGNGETAVSGPRPESSSLSVPVPTPPSVDAAAALTPPSVDASANEELPSHAPDGAAASRAHGAKTGVILLPKSALGHRVFVDGRLFDPKDARIEVPCGSSQVQVGSQAVPRALDVPCGGEVTLR